MKSLMKEKYGLPKMKILLSDIAWKTLPRVGNGKEVELRKGKYIARGFICDYAKRDTARVGWKLPFIRRKRERVVRQ